MINRQSNIHRPALWLCVDHFWLLAGCNLFSLMLCCLIVTAPLGLAGMLGLCHRLVTTRRGSWKDYWAGMRLLGSRMYAWMGALLAVEIWSGLAILFYSRQTPLFAAIGCTVTLCIGAVSALIGFLMFSSLATKGVKESAREALRALFLHPRESILSLADVLLMEGLLLLTGLGFLAFGIVWPLFACLLSSKTLPYSEDRTIKDFFLPQNLLK